MQTPRYGACVAQGKDCLYNCEIVCRNASTGYVPEISWQSVPQHMDGNSIAQPWDAGTDVLFGLMGSDFTDTPAFSGLYFRSLQNNLDVR